MARETIGTAFVRVVAEGKDFGRSLKNTLKDAEPDVEKGGEAHGERYGDGFDKGFGEKVGDRIGARLRKALDQADREGELFGNKFGDAFGKGARNNFVNIVGVLVGALAGAQGAVSGFLQGISGAPSLITRMGAAFLSLGGVVFAVGIAVGVLAAAISGLTAILTALVGVITFAAIGAVGALAGAMLPLIAGVVVLTGGIKSLDGQLKTTLSDAIQPFIDGFKELGDLAARRIFTGIAEVLPLLNDNFDRLRPLVAGVASALNDVIRSFIALGASPAATQFINTMARFLPDAVRQLGDIFTNTFAGLFGLFRGLVPITDRFLAWLVDLSGRFTSFTNTVSGQKALKDFFELAGDSAAAFGALLRETTGLLFDLFQGPTAGGTGGASAGIALFDSLTASVQRLRDFLATPQGSDALKEWLADGVELGKTIGDLVVGIGEFIAGLDNDATQAALGELLDAFTKLFTFIGNNAEVILTLSAAFAILGAAILINAGVTALVNGLLGLLAISRTLGNTILILRVRLALLAVQERLTAAATVLFNAVQGLMVSVMNGTALAVARARIALVLMAVQTRVAAAASAVLNLAQTLLVGIMNGTALATARAGFAAVAYAAATTGVRIATAAWAAVQFILNIALLANPIGLIIVGIAALIAVIVLIVRRTDFFGNLWKKVWGGIKTAFNATFNFIKNNWPLILAILTGPIGLAVLAITKNWDKIKTGFQAVKDFITLRIDLIKAGFQALPESISRLGSKMLEAGKELGRKVIDGLVQGIKAVGNFARDLTQSVKDAINDALNLPLEINFEKGPISIHTTLIPKLASGGIFGQPTIAEIGEAGPEAVVPLDRPLSQVDPAVRELSAFAQGLSRGRSGGTTSTKTIDIGGITVITPTKDPGAVAQETINRLAAAAYI